MERVLITTYMEQKKRSSNPKYQIKLQKLRTSASVSIHICMSESDFSLLSTSILPQKSSHHTGRNVYVVQTVLGEYMEATTWHFP